MRLLIALYVYLKFVRHAFDKPNIPPQLFILVQKNNTYAKNEDNPWDVLINHPFNEFKW